MQTFFQRTARASADRRDRRRARRAASREAAVLLRRRQFRRATCVRARARRGAGAARHPLGHADEHQRGARRGVPRRSLRASGCRGVLIGFESLDEEVLRDMRKNFNTMRGGFAVALANLRRHGIRVYGTFMFGYDGERPEAVRRGRRVRDRARLLHRGVQSPHAVSRARRCTGGCSSEGRLLYERWWLDERTATTACRSSPQRWRRTRSGRAACARAGASTPGAACCARAFDPVNRADAFMFRNFFLINGMHRVEVGKRDDFPLGDPTWHGRLLKAA